MVIPKSRQEIFHIIRHPLALSSFLVFASTFSGNIFAYLFNIFAARLLGPVDYGVLAAVIALMGITGVFSSALSVTVTKFVSRHVGKKEDSAISQLVTDLSKVFLIGGSIVFLFFVLFNSYLAGFFNIPYKFSIILVGAMIFVSNLLTINTATLVGLQKFSSFSLISFSQNFFKFVLGLLFILAGLKVDGAALGIVLTAGLAYLFTFRPLKGIFQMSFGKPNLPWRSLSRYSLPALFSMWGIISLSNSDVILVKKFFDPHSAGIYSFVSLVGRVIFFASASISSVMFPLVSQRQAAGRRYRHLLHYSLLLILSASLLIDIFYFLFPEFVIRFFTGFGKTDYVQGSFYIGFLGLYYVFFSLSNSLTAYFLSVQKTLIASIPPASVAVLQIVLISQFHQNFWQVIISSITSVVLLLLFYLLYLFFYERES